MTLDDIETALGQHLATMADCPPLAWPNKDADHERPFLFVQHLPGPRETLGMDGRAVRTTGALIVTVVAASDAFSRPANAIAQAVIDRFPVALRIAAGAGRVVILKQAEPLPPFRNGADWRQPVRITYGAEPQP